MSKWHPNPLTSLAWLRGGPDFSRATRKTIDCGHAEIALLIPRSHVAPNAPDNAPRSICLGDHEVQYDQSGDRFRTEAPSIKLDSAAWCYTEALLATLFKHPLLPREPYVCITTRWVIERVKQGHVLQRGDLSQLADYLRDDYQLWAVSEHGAWTQKRNYITRAFNDRAYPLEHYQAELEQMLADSMPTLPEQFEPRSFASQPWLRYDWRPEGTLEKRYYSTALDDHHLLTVEFHLTRFSAEFDHKWLPAAEAMIEKLIQHTQIRYKHAVLDAG